MINHSFKLLGLALGILGLALYSAAGAVSGISSDPSAKLYTARQLGMAGLAVAFSDDANGVFSNPADLANAAFPQLSGSSRKLVLDEIQYTLLDWAAPTDWGTFGIGYSGLSMGGSYPTTLDPATSRIVIDASRETTSYDNSVLAFSYARNILSNLSVGGNLKLFNQSLSGGTASKASGTGLDLSAVFKPLRWLTLGANLQNLVEPTLAWQGGASDKMGGFYKLGVKVDVLSPGGTALRENAQKLAVGFDLDLPHNTSVSSNYHLGMEYLPWNQLAVRTGINQQGLSFGLGLINGGFRFDYAFVSNPDAPGDTPHYFSLSYIGERIFSTSRKLLKKELILSFANQKDRLITDKKSMVISVEASAVKTFAVTNTWTVTAVSKTQEVLLVTEPEKLVSIGLNGTGATTQPAETLYDFVAHLHPGRNVLTLTAYASPETLSGRLIPEAFSASREVKVLCIKPFADVPMDFWAIEPIALNVTLGIVEGYPNNEFKPDKGISRAELVALLVRSLPIKTDKLSEVTPFADIPTTHWAAKYIGYGEAHSLVTGYPNNTFKPKKILSRAEGITIIARYAGLSEEAGALPAFPDLEKGFWANKYIAPAKNAGLLDYLAGKEFKAPSPFTRAEACEVLYRTAVIQKMINQWWETGSVIPTSRTQPQTAPR